MDKAKQKVAISPRREEDFSEWFQQVIKASDMAEHSPARGCMTIKPWGWAMWERIRDYLDARIKATGHENAYFPLFVPLSLIEKEASHVEGFAKECAIVTHHRLEEKEGKLIPAGELEEPLVVRPTSEVIIGEAFSRWISSWRDLPLKINQWANVVRWEMRTRLFLRTAEFLWQEGHTAHTSYEEALSEAQLMLEEYRVLFEDLLAVPVIAGRKSESEKFPGAEQTLTLECMTQDRKAIQCCTSHFLGQKFAKAFQIRFDTPDGGTEYAYTTSWGVTTRSIGAMIMVHGDDNGLRLPPKIAPYQIVIIPVLTKSERSHQVLEACRKLKGDLERQSYDGTQLRVHVDERDLRAGEKGWSWVKKGVPIKVEVGPRDLDNESCMITLRDSDDLAKRSISIAQCVESACSMLEEYHKRLFDRAQAFQREHTRSDITSLEEMKAFFTARDQQRPEIHGGFVRANWCQDPETEAMLKQMKVTVRCLPFDQAGAEGKCVLTGRPATCEAIFGKAY